MSRFYPLRRWVAGTYKRECDICGFDFLRSEMIKLSDDLPTKGLVVCKECADSQDTRLARRKVKYNKRRERPFRRD